MDRYSEEVGESGDQGLVSVQDRGPCHGGEAFYENLSPIPEAVFSMTSGLDPRTK